MAKLTLSVDAGVVGAAKRYASEQGTSVSQLVEQYLGVVAYSRSRGAATPALRLLRGAARGAALAHNREYTAHKYGVR